MNIFPGLLLLCITIITSLAVNLLKYTPFYYLFEKVRQIDKFLVICIDSYNFSMSVKLTLSPCVLVSSLYQFVPWDSKIGFEIIIKLIYFFTDLPPRGLCRIEYQ